MNRDPEVLSIEQVLTILPGFTVWSLRNMIRRNQITVSETWEKSCFPSVRVDAME
jgi:hypothetical protein